MTLHHSCCYCVWTAQVMCGESSWLLLQIQCLLTKQAVLVLVRCQCSHQAKSLHHYSLNRHRSRPGHHWRCTALTGTASITPPRVCPAARVLVLALGRSHLAAGTPSIAPVAMEAPLAYVLALPALLTLNTLITLLTLLTLQTWHSRGGATHGITTVPSKHC